MSAGASTDPVVKVLKAFFGVPLLLLGLAATAMPPVLAVGLVWRGADLGHTSWVFLGALSGLIYLLLVFSLLRRAWRALRAGP